MRFEPGALVHDRLRLVRPVGRGGMGSVWIAHHETLDIEIAVKFIASELGGASDLSTVARFQREAQLAAKLAGPHVVRMLDHGVTADGVPYIAMELLRGETLAERLATTPQLEPRDVVRIVSEVAEGLSEAHALGIVHRDIKPQNLFLTKGATGKEIAKILDFGIARAEAKQDGITASGAMLGTVIYMSPEQLLESKSPDKRADLWALAVVAYEALTGRHPFAAETVARTMAAVTRGAFERASRVTRLPVEIDAFFERALALDREARYATAGELAAALAAAAAAPLGPVDAAAKPAGEIDSALASTGDFLAARGVDVAHAPTEAIVTEPAPPEAAAIPPPTSGRRGRRVLLLGAAVPLLAIAVFGVVHWLSGDRSPPAVTTPSASPSAALPSLPSKSPASNCEPSPSLVAPPRGECPRGMLRIEGGTFVTGLPEGGDALRAETERRHESILPAFCIDVVLTSAGDFESAMPADTYATRTVESGATSSNDCTAGTAASSTYPMNCVSSEAAACYCSKLGKRLPTEDEWEYAAHARGERYPWGAADPKKTAEGGPCWQEELGPCTLENVPKDSQRWSTRGLLDMAGNLWQWTNTPDCSLAGACGDRRVVRGGSWRDSDVGGSTKIGPKQLSAALHHSHRADERSNNVGFRCVRDLEPPVR